MIISIANQKGGVGKTTTTQALFSGLIAKKFKVLAVDLDPQSNMSTALGADITKQSIYDVLINKAKIIEAIQTLNLGGDIVPSNILLAGAEIELNQKMKREELLLSYLKQIQNLYDFILIDTPPALGKVL